MGNRRARAAPRDVGLAPEEHLIIGRNAVRELLAHCPERIKMVYTTSGNGSAGLGGRRELCAGLTRSGVVVKEVGAAELDAMAGTDSHQAFVAKVAGSKKMELNEFLALTKDREHSIVLALDSITDPHNVGAIFRAACCFNIDAVLLSKNRGAGITTTVSKTSAGASELVTKIEVSNLAQALRRCHEAGYWITVAEAHHDGQDLRNFDPPGKMVVVMGSEGEGVQDLVLRDADFKVFIPMFGKIESLNVSQATAVVLYALCSHSKSR